MSGEELRAAVRSLLESHPTISVSAAGHAPHVERYVATNGAPLGFEPRTVRFQNLWVRTDAMRAWKLVDIDSRFYSHSNFGVSKPNHNLFGEPRFKNTDLVCFKVTDLWQAVRVITEVAGVGA